MIYAIHVDDATACGVRYITYLDRHRHEPHLLAVITAMLPQGWRTRMMRPTSKTAASKLCIIVTASVVGVDESAAVAAARSWLMVRRSSFTRLDWSTASAKRFAADHVKRCTEFLGKT